MKPKSIKIMLAGLILVIPMFIFSVSLFSNNNVFASDVTDFLNEGATNAQGNDTPDKLIGGDSIIKDITNTMLFVIGAVSVLMLIYGGIRYAISGGGVSSASGSEVKAVSAAKSIITYSVIGLVVAITAYAIVNWVISRFIVP